MPVREGRRNRPSRKVVEPLVGVFDDHDLDRVVAALGISLGTDSVLEVGQAIAIRHFEQPLCSGYLLHGTV